MALAHSTPTAADVESFIGTLETSYSYDPPERWRDAYNQLRALRPRFQAARKPYAWLPFAGLLTLLTVAVAMAARTISLITPVDYLWLGLLFVVPVFEGIAAHLAQRREPLLHYEGRIDDACRKFDKVIAETNNAPA